MSSSECRRATTSRGSSFAGAACSPRCSSSVAAIGTGSVSSWWPRITAAAGLSSSRPLSARAAPDDPPLARWRSGPRWRSRRISPDGAARIPSGAPMTGAVAFAAPERQALIARTLQIAPEVWRATLEDYSRVLPPPGPGETPDAEIERCLSVLAAAYRRHSAHVPLPVESPPRVCPVCAGPAVRPLVILTAARSGGGPGFGHRPLCGLRPRRLARGWPDRRGVRSSALRRSRLLPRARRTGGRLRRLRLRGR